MMRKTMLLGLLAALALTAGAVVNWDDALIVGHTNGEKCFFKAGEEMVFTLSLAGVRGEIPPDAYFIDWERTANDGKTERGRAPASLQQPLVVKTSLDRPGFVKIEANLVDKSGRRVPKNHMWEKRVFFQGGAGVDVDKLQAWPEPADFDAHWAAEVARVDALPLTPTERKPIPCANPKLNLWQVTIPVLDGFRPMVGYLAIPKAASASNRVKATGHLSGYYMWKETCPDILTNQVDGIQMYVNRHGCEGDREEAYYKPFLKNPPYGADHFRGMALRGLMMFRYLKSLPEWDGKTLESKGSSGGAMQSLWMAALVPGLTRIDIGAPALADVFGFKYGRATGNLGVRDEAINYYDICNFAKRITIPVSIGQGLGDYTCPPFGIAIVYNNLRGPKMIDWKQGTTHGWWPGGMAVVRFSDKGGAKLEAKVGAEHLVAGKGNGGDVLRVKEEDGERALSMADAVTDDGALAARIAQAVGAGERSITIERGDYRLKGGAGVFFTLSGVSDTVIDFSGSRLVGLRPHRMFALDACTNVTIRNVTIDYDPLPFTQAHIVKRHPNGDWDLAVIDGYPDPDDCGDPWPMQAFDPVNFEMKNPMRCWDGFKLAKTGPMRYRVSGGRDRRGDVGDVCVWSLKRGDGGSLASPNSYVASLFRCRSCRLEGVTAYAAPNGMCLIDIRGDGNAFVRCVLDRCPPGRDYAKRGLKRLRSGSHDGLNARMCKKAPLIENCTIRYQCDDCVNISGQFAYVSEVNGSEVRILDKVTAWGFGAPVEPGDVLQVMAGDGSVRAPAKVASVRAGTPPARHETAAMGKMGLWPGQETEFRYAYVLRIEGENPIRPSDFVVSDNARGNGYVIRGCTFGPNRANGMRIRGGHGLIESNTVNGVEGPALQLGQEYEWLEGGVFDDVIVRGNRFVGCGGSFDVGGTSAHRGKAAPRSHPGLVVEDNLILSCRGKPAFDGCEGAMMRNNVYREK